LRAWKDHTPDHFHCPYYKEEDDPYKKKPDEIDPKFIGLYHSEYQKRLVTASLLVEKKDTKIATLLKWSKLEDGDSSALHAAANEMIEELIWANEALRWARVHLFCDRFEQVKDLRGAAQCNPDQPARTPHQKLFKLALDQLERAVNDVDRRVEELPRANTERLTLKELTDRARALNLHRQMVFRHCDSFYRDLGEV
jgi:hypothetical protein